jgi:hypothetical protein
MLSEARIPCQFNDFSRICHFTGEDSSEGAGDAESSREVEKKGGIDYDLARPLGSRPRAGHMTLDHGILVRIQASQPAFFPLIF